MKRREFEASEDASRPAFSSAGVCESLRRNLEFVDLQNYELSSGAASASASASGGPSSPVGGSQTTSALAACCAEAESFEGEKSVAVEEIEVALLQRGCILNFVSIFFGLKEPFTAVVRENAQVFAISKQELFKHMPQSQ